MGSLDPLARVHKDLEPDKAVRVARARAGIGIGPKGILGTPWKASLPELRRRRFMGRVPRRRVRALPRLKLEEGLGLRLRLGLRIILLPHV
jgi:hypothetical protein